MRLKKTLVILTLNLLILLISVTARAEGIHYLGLETANPVWEGHLEEEKGDSEANKEVTIDDNHSSDTSAGQKKSYITAILNEKAVGIGLEDFNDKFGYGIDYSICDLYPSKDAKEKKRHWGIDLYLLLPITKCINLGLGGGWYCYSAESIGFSWDDKCTNSGGLIDLQYHTGKYLISY